MWQLSRRLLRFIGSEEGPTAVEYAVMLALIIIVCLVAITTLGARTEDVFDAANAPLAGS